MDCAFCSDPSIQGRKIIENDLAMAFLNKMPIVTGHILIIPKRCVGDFASLEKEELQAVWDLKLRLRRLFLADGGTEGFNFAWNEGSMAGQSVPHFHLHLLPRKTGDQGIYEYEPRRFLYRPDVVRVESSEQELNSLAEFLRGQLGRSESK